MDGGRFESERTASDAEPDAAAPADRDGVAGALRTLVGLRSRTAVRDRPLPELAAHLRSGSDDVETRYAALQELVDRAVGVVADPDHRAAAQHLLAFGEGRWRPLKQRGADAAAVFGLGWDAYRRRRPSTGTSALEETLDEVAKAILGPTGGPRAAPRPVGVRRPSVEVSIIDRAPDAGEEPGGGVDPVPSTAGTGRRARRLVPAPAVALVVVAVLGATWWATSRSDRGDASEAAMPAATACANLIDEVGTVRAGSEPSLQTWAEPFRHVASELDADRSRCAGPIETTRDQVFERISAGDGASVEALVATTGEGPAAVVTLQANEFGSFRASELEAAAPEDRIGTPVGRADLDDGTRVVELTTGAIVSGPGNGPSFPVTRRFWQDWLARGGLADDAGRPIGHAYAAPGEGRIQNFEHGRLRASYVDGEIRWEPLADGDRQVPQGHEGAILRSLDGLTSWYVDYDGIRHWLPTAQDHRCLANTQDAPVIDEVPPAAIEALPSGKAFTCR